VGITSMIRHPIRTVSGDVRLLQVLGTLSRAGLVPDSLRRRLGPKVPMAFGLRARGARFRYGFVPGDSIGRSLFWHGVRGYEPETVKVFTAIARSASWLLDIGANTGLFALLACAANPDIETMAFEPLPTTAERLRRNIELNDWEARCTVRVCAVSDAEGTSAFHVPPGLYPDMASLGATGWRGLAGEVIQVPTTTVDAGAATTAGPGLIKIDVEGHEDKVLRGAAATLQRCRPVVVVECNPEGPYEAVEQILIAQGYALYHLRARGPVAVGQILPDARDIGRPRARNFLALPQEKDIASFGLSPAV